MNPMQRTRRHQRGMMMLEVLIALLIFTVGVLGMVKMQAVASSNSVNSEDRATAALLADDLIAQMWAAKPISAQPSAAVLAGWTARVQASLRGADVSASTFPGAAGPGTATIVIKWNRQMGLNVEGGIESGSTMNTAVYSTQVVIQ